MYLHTLAPLHCTQRLQGAVTLAWLTSVCGHVDDAQDAWQDLKVALLVSMRRSSSIRWSSWFTFSQTNKGHMKLRIMQHCLPCLQTMPSLRTSSTFWHNRQSPRLHWMHTPTFLPRVGPLCGQSNLLPQSVAGILSTGLHLATPTACSWAGPSSESWQTATMPKLGRPASPWPPTLAFSTGAHPFT